MLDKLGNSLFVDGSYLRLQDFHLVIQVRIFFAQLTVLSLQCHCPCLALLYLVEIAEVKVFLFFAVLTQSLHFLLKALDLLILGSCLFCALGELFFSMPAKRAVPVDLAFQLAHELLSLSRLFLQFFAFVLETVLIVHPFLLLQHPDDPRLQLENVLLRVPQLLLLLLEVLNALR